MRWQVIPANFVIFCNRSNFCHPSGSHATQGKNNDDNNNIGKPMAWNVTVPDTYAESHIGSTTTKPGAAAKKTAQNKIDKYSKLASTHIFYRFAIETAGTWHEMPLSSHKRLAGVSPLSRNTPGKQHSFSNAFPWLCKEKMRFLSTTPNRVNCRCNHNFVCPA